MAGGANRRYRCSARWSCAMVAVAGNAGGSAQISAHGQRFMVNALVVFRELVGGDLVFLHPRLVGVATSASSWNVDRIHRGALVAGWPNIVHGMAVHTDGDLGV